MTEDKASVILVHHGVIGGLKLAYWLKYQKRQYQNYQNLVYYRCLQLD